MEELNKELEKLSKAYKITPKNEENILMPFIKKLLELPMKERRKLLPTIRELQWIKSKFAGYSSESFCSKDRACFLSAVQFVCGNKREMDMAYHVNFDMLCKLLPLYSPTWLSDLINDDKSWFNFDLNYEELMQLIDLGYLKELAPNRIAAVFPRITVIRNKEKKNKGYNSQLLLKRDVTLKEHIWTIFEHESSIGYENDSAKTAFKEGVTARDESMSAAFYRFSLDGHIDRERLLKVTLATFQRSFKKDMMGWFAGLFEELQPTTKELISLQEEIMQGFTSSYSKPVNVMLQQLKKIAAEKDFHYQEFIERATTLFFSSPKNSLVIIYAIFEQIVTQHPEMQETCCIALSQLFLKKDESLQKKAANFILKYGNASSVSLKEVLSSYQPEMLQSAQEMLISYLAKSEESKSEVEEEPIEDAILPNVTRICREDNCITLPTNKDDFLFQLSRLFDMEESWEVDATIASIIAFQPQLNDDDFNRMEPVFQRAADIVANGWEIGKDFLATFFLEYGRFLMESNTSITTFMTDIFAQLKERDKNRGNYDERSFVRLEKWKPKYSNSNCFEPTKQLWLEAIRKIKEKDSLLLLSTPTHTPAYIRATEFIQRLAAYQNAKQSPNSWDFQLAIARCALDEKEEAIVTARKLLKGEYLNLCLFLFDKMMQPEPPYSHQTAWVTAGLVKEPETEFEAFKSFSCNILPHHYLAGEYDLKEIELKENKNPSDSQFLQLGFYNWNVYNNNNSHQLWQEYLIINSKYSDDSNYMEFLMCCFPNHPELLITQIISCYMDFGASSEDNKRTIACALRMLLSFHCQLKEISLLLLSGSLLLADKTVRSYAAELWVEGLSTGRIDNRRVGKILAKLINLNLAPLKRFITQAYESMYKRSTFHNQQLEELLTVFISGLPEKPVTGQKQLLELYLELLNINNSKVTDSQLLERLGAWKEVANLKKVVTSISNR